MAENQTEVEFMGSLNQKKFEELKKLFEKEGSFKKNKERLTFMYFRDRIPKDLSEIKDEFVDLRFRVTNKEPEIVLKYGLFSGSHARREISIYPKDEEVEKYLEMLALLGWNIGVINATKTHVYDYHGIEFALVEIKDFGYNFEAEILTNEKWVEEAKKKITFEIDRLGIRPFDEAGLNEQCNAINNKKDLQFDLLGQPFSEIRERFKEYFA